MRHRAAIILFEDVRIALIKRMRNGHTYYVFPGGGIEAGETPEEAAKREALEELGLEVDIGPIVFESIGAVRESYFLAQKIGGEFGAGTGREFTVPDAERGSYEAVWLSIEMLSCLKVYPEQLAEKITEDWKQHNQKYVF